MKHLIAVLGAAVSVAAGGSLANAADLPMMAAPIASVPQQSLWTGPYIGADVGYMFGSTAVTDQGVVTETGAATDGFIGGIYGGYNWQIDDSWVAGLEGDVSLASVHGNGNSTPPQDTPNSYDLNWAANIRGRIGFLIMPDTLLYAPPASPSPISGSPRVSVPTWELFEPAGPSVRASSTPLPTSFSGASSTFMPIMAM
jgi:outer membrane immunogenic protein